MSTVGQREVLTQQRVISLFRNPLRYAYLGHWQGRGGNSNVEKANLTGWLRRRGQGHAAPAFHGTSRRALRRR